MTKEKLREIYLAWAREELDVIFLIEAIAQYLGEK